MTKPQKPDESPRDILRLIANNLTEMVMAYDMDRRLIFVNHAVETLTGYTIAEMQSANFICWVHPDDQPRMLPFWDTLFQGRSFHDEEYRLVTKDGRVKWVVASWRPILDDLGRQVGVQGREFDITQRRLAEAAIRQSEERLRVGEERYRVLFEDSPFPMWEEDFSQVRQFLDAVRTRGVKDVAEFLRENPSAVEDCLQRVRILDVNRAARSFYGASGRDDLIGGLAPIFDRPAFEVFRDELVAFVGNATEFHAELPVRTLRDEERLVDMIVTIADSARHDWSRVIVCFLDITDRKRLEEQFLQSQKMESVGRLAGGIAHDFNNLLTVINGYTDWMLSEMEAENPLRADLTHVRKAGERCAELTQQLLLFSRKQIVRPVPLNLNVVIGESQEAFERTLGGDIQLVTELAADLWVIDADRGQIEQLVMSLATNARDAMPTGGVFTIRTSHVADSPQVLLEVRDTGEEIDEDVRRHLFEPFVTTRKGRKNTGLGLAVVFGIVSNCGGRIEVESAPGSGTTFRIFLPKGAATAVEPAANMSPGKTDRGSGRILVVEDRDDVRLLTCQMLQKLGYDPLPAAGGAEALRLVHNLGGAVSLVLTDVVMPDMNGRELAETLQRSLPGLKTIYMSGNTDHLLTHTGTLGPSTHYLQKPFTLIELAAMMRRVFE